MWKVFLGAAINGERRTRKGQMKPVEKSILVLTTLSRAAHRFIASPNGQTQLNQLNKKRKH